MNEPITGFRIVDDFLVWLRHSGNFSRHTARTYQFAIQSFMKHWGNDPRKAGPDDVQAWIVALMQDGLSNRSAGAKLSAVRTMFDYLQRYKEHVGNPARLVRAPKFTAKLPDVPEQAEVDVLLGAPFKLAEGAWPGGIGRDRRTFIQYRDACLLEVLYGAGLRIHEARKLNTSDIDPERKMIHVIGKGGTDEWVPMGSKAFEAWKEFESLREVCAGDSDAVFISMAGNRMRTDSLRARFEFWAKVAGFPNLTPHVLRHACATHMLEGGANLRVIQQQLRHKQITTTQLYTHVRPQTLRDQHAAHHPRG
jgi:site-specific recombinase XerD